MISYVYRRCVDATREGRLAFLNKAGADGLEYVAGLAETSALGEGGADPCFVRSSARKILSPMLRPADGRVVADVPLHFEIGLQHRVSVSVSGPFGFDGAEFDVETSPGGEGGSVRAWTEDPHGHELRAVVATETRDAMVAGARSALDEVRRATTLPTSSGRRLGDAEAPPAPIDDGTTFSIKEAWNRLSHHRQSEILALYVETTRASTTGMLFSEFFATLPEGRS